MATPAQWLEGARPRTLPAAVADQARRMVDLYADAGQPERAIREWQRAIREDGQGFAEARLDFLEHRAGMPVE